MSCLLRSQAAFNCACGVLCLKSRVLSFPSKFLTVTLAAALWVRRAVSLLGTRCKIVMYLLESGCSLTHQQQSKDFSVSKTLNLVGESGKSGCLATAGLMELKPHYRDSCYSGLNKKTNFLAVQGVVSDPHSSGTF